MAAVTLAPRWYWPHPAPSLNPPGAGGGLRRLFAGCAPAVVRLRAGGGLVAQFPAPLKAGWLSWVLRPTRALKAWWLSLVLWPARALTAWWLSWVLRLRPAP
ncbi:hypothetical protein GCM10010394_60120 [Streptomyces crystallinus]|uniref:Uncharacterized protein n=1 Tax=Streptomyces crystallinus TaxID=68191 RepID=A0ABN1GW27_9ACTN